MFPTQHCLFQEIGTPRPLEIDQNSPPDPPTDFWLPSSKVGNESRVHKEHNCNTIRSSDKLFRYGDFFSEKIIVGPQEAQDPRFWLPWTMTHYILGSICFRTPPTPPIWLETPKCAILSTFSESGGKNHPNVEVRREKFYIGNLSLLFLWPSIYVGTMSFHFRNIFQ